MARKAKYDWGKTRSSQYQKFETSVTLKFDVTSDGQDTVYVDAAQCLSLVNRKLVRQGHVFEISNMRSFSLDSDANVIRFGVSALPRTWMMFNAYKKGRSLWNQMNLEALDALGSGNLPKYYDYKVYYDREHFDNDHNDDGGALTSNLLPVDQDGNTITPGDWVYSKYESSGSTALEWNCHVLGGHATTAGALEGDSGKDLPANLGSLGLILAYQQSRGITPTDEDMSGLTQGFDIDSPWAKLFAGDDQMQEVLTDLQNDNDGPPYPADYTGGIVHPEGRLVSMGTFNTDDYVGWRVPKFEAPLGLIKLDCNSGSVTNDTSDIWVTFDARIKGTI